MCCESRYRSLLTQCLYFLRPLSRSAPRCSPTTHSTHLDPWGSLEALWWLELDTSSPVVLPSMASQASADLLLTTMQALYLELSLQFIDFSLIASCCHPDLPPVINVANPRRNDHQREPLVCLKVFLFERQGLDSKSSGVI